MATVRVLLLGLATAALARSPLLRKLVAHWRKGTYGGLESLVSFSSRLIAAARAVESLRPDAFVVDPLAWILAGPTAMAKYKDDPAVKAAGGAGNHLLPPAQACSQPPSAAWPPSAACPPTPQAQQEQQQSSGAELRPVPRLIMRTCFFDDAALAAVGSPKQRSLQCMAPLLQHVQQHGLPACRQVVLLGSGMDTRPWRLPLPPGVAWFEVDRRDVLAAKRAELTKAGVKFTPCSTGSSSDRSSASSTTWLKACSWSCASADLQLPGWTHQLVAAGLDVSQPIAWLAEGLMYYLVPDCVAGMLQEAASISAPGSIFAANFLTAEGIAVLHSRSAAANSSGAASTEGTSADGGGSAAADGAASGNGSDARSNAEGAVATTSSSSSKPSGSGLLSQFKWGCPDDVQQFWSAQGWHILQCLSWRQAAAQYGWQPQVTAAAVDRPPTQEVQFALAVLA